MKKYFSVFGLHLSVDSKQQQRFVDNMTTDLQHIPKAADGNYGCDERGNIIFVVDLNGVWTDYVYDDKNCLVEVLYADETRQMFAYNDQGDISQTEDRNGERITYRYDAFGRLRSVVYPDESTVISAYDDARRICCMRAEGCDTRDYFNPAGLLIKMERVMGSVTYITEYAYNDRGQCTGMRCPGNNGWLEYRYDDENRIQRIGVTGGREICTFNYGEDSAVQVIFGNGVVTCYHLQPGSAEGEITTFSSDNPAEALVSLQYTSDDAGRIVQIGDIRYRYDREERIVDIQNGAGDGKHYTYDAFGNRLSEISAEGETTYQYDTFSRLIAQHSTNNRAVVRTKYRYDAKGNLIEKTCGEKQTTYEYNGQGRLAEVSIDGKVISQYAYSPEGWRIKKNVGGDVTLYHYDQTGRPITETDAHGRVKATFIWWGAQCLARIRGAIECPEIEYYHVDHLNTFQAATDVNGNICRSAEHTPFGEILSGSKSDATFPYMGKWKDEETGLYYFGSRYYDTQIGRFITADAFTFAPNDPRLLKNASKDFWGCKKPGAAVLRKWLMTPQNLNPYVFCHNNPVNYLDVDGHSAWWFFLTIPLSFSWVLPATALGLFLYIIDLVFEFINLLVAIVKWICQQGFTATWERMHWPKITGSARLGVPWMFIARGGAFVSLLNAFGGRGPTIGNFFFITRSSYTNYENATGIMLIPKDPYVTPHSYLRALQTHEMQHVFQYTLCGIFFLVSPALLLGFYFWDLIVNGGTTNSSFERNAGANSGLVYKTLVEVEKSTVWAGEPTLVVGATPVTFNGPAQPITFTISPTVPTGLVSPVPAGAARGQKTNNFNGVAAINGEGFYFRAPNPSPPAVRQFQVTGDARGRNETVDIEVKPVTIDAPSETYVCSENLLRLQDKDKKGTYSLDFHNNTSGGSISGFRYYTGTTVGVDRLKLRVRYNGRRTVNAAISDFGTNYEIYQFNIRVNDITITANPATVFVGGNATISINGPERFTLTTTFAVTGSTYNRTTRAYTAGRGPIASNQTDTLRFVFTAGGNTCTKEVSITVRPITAAATPPTVGSGNNAAVSVTGGTGPYRYSITTNNSGGTINETTGAYTAGATAGVDTITVTDANGGRGTTTITVT